MKIYKQGKAVHMQFADLLGIRLTGATITELNRLICTAVATDEKWILANHNLHSLYLFHHDPKLREFFSRSRLAHADGMSLIALARFLGHPFSRDQRVTYADWVWPLMKEASTQGWRVFFVGSRPGVGESASEVLNREYPGLDLVVHHGYFDSRPDSAENLKILQRINYHRPHVLMVGMGMPRQEHWILDNFEQLVANVILPAGACMDYVAGAVSTPPRWMGRIGLEWLYRLACEPRRLGRRYLIEPWFIIWLLTKDSLRRIAGKRQVGQV
jgi:N-acetylglucosaminyldiphosphoundecaprenol N-acetyl-beta-D-mannosaminyltransferase